MTLRAIVRALGGDLYDQGRRANVPAPGHSAQDRSVSLLLTDGRVVVHSFGGATWSEVLEDLRRRDLVDGAGRCTGWGRSVATPRPDAGLRVAMARRLWDSGTPTGRSGRVARYLRRRGVRWSKGLGDLLEHPHAPVSVYRQTGRTLPALMAGVRAPDGGLTAVELTYLRPNGAAALELRLPRKTVGQVPAGSAVRLCPPSPAMVVAEGLITTLSAMRRFDRPGWALLSAGNLARWRAPAGVSDVLIAADRGSAGETAAARLQTTLTEAGVTATIALPPPPWGDWNEVDQASRGEERGGL